MTALVSSEITEVNVVASFICFDGCGGMGGVGALLAIYCTGEGADVKNTFHSEHPDWDDIAPACSSISGSDSEYWRTGVPIFLLIILPTSSRCC